MFKGIFEAAEAVLKATSYLLILLMGAAMVGLGAYITLLSAFRIAQLLYVLLFQEPWV